MSLEEYCRETLSSSETYRAPVSHVRQLYNLVGTPGFMSYITLLHS